MMPPWIPPVNEDPYMQESSGIAETLTVYAAVIHGIRIPVVTRLTILHRIMDTLSCAGITGI